MNEFKVGRFEVVGHLASGGMAEVLLGHLRGPSGFEKPVVLKRVLPHLAKQPRFVDMFLDEARLVAQIRHPNVVQVQELTHEGEDLFIVMEYLEGESVASLVRRIVASKRQLPYGMAAHIIAEACAGLHAAHELQDTAGQSLGIVHRDVSPQNLFVTYGGGVKVLDFGIAVARDRTTRTETGQLKGKFEYMSPEQCLARPIDRRTDVFALGTVLYEISLGRRLFKRANQLLTLRAITREDVPAPRLIDPNYPAELERIVLKALARNLDERYQSAAEMRRDLSAFQRSLADDALPDEALAATMREYFEARIVEKQDMLRRVQGGSDITDLPPAEVDEEVEVPEIPGAADGLTSGGTGLVTSTYPTRASGSRRWWLVAAAALFAVVGLGALGLALQRPDKVARLEAGLSSLRLPAAHGNEATTDAPVPNTHQLRVASEPAGAEIFVDGELRGKTPAKISLQHATQAVRIEVAMAGYASEARSIVPEKDVSLAVNLKPTPRSAGAPKPAPKPKYETW
ncbi:MAG: serine/threonine-protein kinase [Polyangiaceae bacterium]